MIFDTSLHFCSIHYALCCFIKSPVLAYDYLVFSHFVQLCGYAFCLCSFVISANLDRASFGIAGGPSRVVFEIRRMISRFASLPDRWETPIKSHTTPSCARVYEASHILLRRYPSDLHDIPDIEPFLNRTQSLWQSILHIVQASQT
jgi:hypothetical protein